MADVQPKAVKLSAERWKALCGHVEKSVEAETVEVAEPIEIDGLVFLPATYFCR